MNTIDKNKLMQWSLYERYCFKHSNNLQTYQMLLANSRINRYFNKEVEKKEKEVTNTLQSVTTKKDKLHNVLMLEVLELHSPILIQEETLFKECYYPIFIHLN